MVRTGRWWFRTVPKGLVVGVGLKGGGVGGPVGGDFSGLGRSVSLEGLVLSTSY